MRPIEALVPGARGKVLGVLARASAELSMRTVAELAEVSVQQASVVLRELVRLGIIDRREAPPSALVQLCPTNLAAGAVRDLLGLRDQAIEWMARHAPEINPAPEALVLFGSFARGQARAESDIDVLAVRPGGLDAQGETAWYESIGAWQDATAHALGNPVNLIEAGAEELRAKLSAGGESVWLDALTEGITLAGSSMGPMPWPQP